MADERERIELFSRQEEAVYQTLLREGVCFSRAAYIRRKYQESAEIFLTAYKWYAAKAQRYVPKPEGAELPYWAFADTRAIGHDDGRLLRLSVPREQALLFDLRDWARILNLDYLAESEQQERAFKEELQRQGIRAADALLGNFYPLQKRQILDSWQRLFRYQQDGAAPEAACLQAGLWQLKAEWLIEVC